jgi:phosphoserine phosphatase RsbU/P
MVHFMSLILYRVGYGGSSTPVNINNVLYPGFNTQGDLVRLSIRWKLIFSIVGPLVIISIAVMWFTMHRIYQYSVQQRIEQATQLAKNYADRLDGHFGILSQVAHDLASFIEVNDNLNEVDIYELLRSNINRNPLVFGSAIAFEPYQFKPDLRLFSPYAYRDGNVIKSIDIGKQAYDYTENKWEWYTRTKTINHPIWTEPYFDEGAGNILMGTYAVPFYKNGEFRGVATIDIPLNELQAIVSSEYLQNQPFIIVSSKGRFISHPDPAMIMHETIQHRALLSGDAKLKKLAEELLSGHSGVIRVKHLELLSDEPLWIFYAPLEETGWGLATAVAEDEILEFLKMQITRGTIGISILIILVIISILLIGTHITRPILHLANIVKQLGGGNFSVNINNIKSQDEIGDLARAFKHMVEQLKYHIQVITRETASREAFESELRIAREIQSSLLPNVYPPFPDRNEFDLAALNVPAKHIAGDFFDYFFIDNDHLVLLVADVSGKGAPSAIVMAVTRTIIRNLSGSGMLPACLLQETNKTLLETRIENTFVTIFIAVYNPRTGELVYANAGHQPPYVLDPVNGISKLGEATGTIVGMLEDLQIEDRTARLEPGQYLIIYTDGIPEARNPKGSFYGEQQFSNLLVACNGMTSMEACEHVLSTVTTYQVNNLVDDITILILKRNQ